MQVENSNPIPPAFGPSRGQLRSVLWALRVFAVALIFASARGDLWLDEIWSIQLATQTDTAWGIFSSLHHDNNHPLNSLFLYLLGDSRPLFSYRLVSIFAGSLCVFLVGHAAEKNWGMNEAIVSTGMTAVCYPLLIYFSEARGYSLALMFALLAYVNWRRYFKHGRLANLILFWVASGLGLLSHGTFVIAIIAFAIGQILHEYGQPSSKAKHFRRVVLVNLAPAMFTVFWYLFFLDGLTIGGGNKSSIGR